MLLSKLPCGLFFRFLAAAALLLPFSLAAHAQAPAAAPDVLVFTNGDQLTGKLLREVGGTVTFHSDMAGDITVSWDKIKSLQSSQQFAVITQGTHINRKQAATDVPQGSVKVEDNQVKVTPAASGTEKDIATKDAAYMIDTPTFTKEIGRNPSLKYGWSGSVTFGAALIEATQNSRSFTGGAALSRTIPTVSWLDPRQRTTIGFTSAYGTVDQPGVATTKTNILDFTAEQDRYVSPRFYFLADAEFTHNYSQGLDLQQLYGGGVGYTLIKTPKQELDLKADVHFERQTYFILPLVPPPPPTPSKNLVGADFGDVWAVKLPKGMVFNQTATITPAFNNTNAYSAIAGATLVFPVYKRLGFSVGALDDFLNDPAFGSKKNSFQFTAGINYTLK
jgi:hypothetical protein